VIATITVTVCLFWVGIGDGIGFHPFGVIVNVTHLPVALGLYGYGYLGHSIFPNICLCLCSFVLMFYKVPQISVLLSSIWILNLTNGMLQYCYLLYSGKPCHNFVVYCKKCCLHTLFFSPLFRLQSGHTCVCSSCCLRVSGVWRVHYVTIHTELITTTVHSLKNCHLDDNMRENSMIILPLH
jgi:hypothetical protein